MAVTVRLGTTAVIVAFIFFVGYVIIFIAVVRRDTMSSLQATAFLHTMQHTVMEAEKNEAGLRRPVSVPNGAPTARAATTTADRPGVIVLGMHRSGTSIIGGLLNKMGLATGGPLIRPWKDNEKGFFERIDVVLQNDYIMHKQGVDYSANTHRYDALKGLKEVLNNLEPSDGKFFNEGRRALSFLNDPHNYPWMLKDPRLCVTLRTWLPLLNFVPLVEK